MPVQTYSRVEDLYDKIKYLDDSEDDAEAQDWLEEGHHIMEQNVGRHFEQQKRVTRVDENGDLKNTVRLRLRPVLKMVEILRLGNEVVPESKYTVNKDEGTVTFDSDWVEDNLAIGNVLTFKYVPEIFAEIEVWRAVEEYRAQELIQLEDEEQKSLMKEAERKAKKRENTVNRYTGPGTATDGRVMRGTK